MPQNADAAPQDDVVISAEALKKAEEYIEEEEGATNHYTGWLATALTAAAIVMSLFHLYAAFAIVPALTVAVTYMSFFSFSPGLPVSMRACSVRVAGSSDGATNDMRP